MKKNQSIKHFSKITCALLIASHITSGLVAYGWNIKNVFEGMSTNVTSPGSYQDQAAGYFTRVVEFQ